MEALNLSKDKLNIEEMLQNYSNDCVVFLVTYTKKGKLWVDFRYIDRTKNDRILRSMSRRKISPILFSLDHIMQNDHPKNKKIVIVTHQKTLLDNESAFVGNDKGLHSNLIKNINDNGLELVEIVVKDGGPSIHAAIGDKKLLRKKNTPPKKSDDIQLREHDATAQDNKETVQQESAKSKKKDKKKHRKQQGTESQDVAGNNTNTKNQYKKYKPTKIEDGKFNYRKFLQENNKWSILFVSGSRDPSTGLGFYVCRLRKGDSLNQKLVKVDIACTSPYEPMLISIFDCCNEHVGRNKILNVVLPAEIGFNHPNKSANNDLLMRIFEICEQKKITMKVVHINGGGETLRKIVTGEQ